MKFSSTSSVVLATALFGGLARAHTRVIAISVDGVDQGVGAGVYIRQPPSNSPVKDLKSADIMCNVNGGTAASSSITAAAGSTLTPEWFHDNRGDDIIDLSHKGPIVAYLAPAASNGAGNVWTKISEENYDGTSWPVDKLVANKGKHNVKLPATLAPGEYIARFEILALHESDTLFTEDPARGIQLYPSCAQITVTGSGTTALPAGVAFPGAYTDAEPGIKFNLYTEDPNSYVVPGPAVWDGKSDGTTPATSASSAPTASSAAPSSSAAASSSVVSSPAVTVSSSVVSPPAVTASSSVVSPPAVTASSSAVVAPPAVTASSTQASVPSSVPSVSSSSAAPPAASGTIIDANVCMRNYNQCLDKTQPKPDFTGCSATKDACLSTATYNVNMLNRARQIGTYGRLL